MSQSDWAADQVSLDRPNVARMWDYYLGGFHNFAIDRQAAEYAMRLYPDMPLVARTTRSFLRRAMGFLLEQGIDQFLDIGSGMPTAGNVHEIALGVNPDARVVYLDVDPVVVSHSQAILRGVSNVVAIQADARRPEELLERAAVRQGLDWSRPIGLLTIALFHLVAVDAEVRRILRAFRKAIPNGSYLVLTHATADGVDASLAREGEQNYERANAPLHFRRHAQILSMFEGFDLIDPGVVYLPLWHPDPEEELVNAPVRSANYAGVGRLRPR
jgi:hypothetical protein